MSNENNNKRALAINLSREYEYSHITGRIRVWHEYEKGDAKPGGYDSHLTWTSSGKALERILVSSQANNDRRGDGFYAWQIIFKNVSYADAAEIAAMHCLISRTEKKLERMNEKEGRPLSLGQFLVRTARALDCCEAIIKRGRNGDEIREVTVGLGDLQFHVDNLVEEYKEGKESVYDR